MQPNGETRGKCGQVIVEYCVLSLLLLLGIVGLWRALVKNTPGQLNLSMQQAVRCIADPTAKCK